jgi:hypothetical protein
MRDEGIRDVSLQNIPSTIYLTFNTVSLAEFYINLLKILPYKVVL